MEKHIRPVIFEHLRYEFDVHVLNVDLLNGDRISGNLKAKSIMGSYLKTFVQHHDCLIELLLRHE